MDIFFLIIMISFVLTPILAVSKHAVPPYLDGTKKIDHLKYPTLARAQRIHWYSNVKAREVEASTRLKVLTNKKNDIILESGNASAKAVALVREKHNAAIQEWLYQFAEITREEDERKRLAALEVWKAEEKVRIKQFMADQKALQALEQEQAAELLRSRENDVQALRKYYVPDHNNQSFGYRIVSVHGLYVRKLPIKGSRMVDNLTTGAMLSVNGWITGEELYDNPIWFKLANNAGWVWSGGVDNKSTSGLVNYNYMNEPGDSFVQKSFDGSIVSEYAAPSEMKTLIDAEIVAIEREKDALALKMRGDNPWGMISADRITSERLTVGPSLTSITRNGQTLELAKFKESRKDWYTESLQKREKRGSRSRSYDPSGGRSGYDTNYWRGTEFETM